MNRLPILFFAAATLALPALPAAVAQTVAPPAASPAPSTAQQPADPAVLSVEVANKIPPVDKSNLQSYWNDVQNQVHGLWLQVIPTAARPPESTPGTVKILAWVHTDGRVTGMTLEQPSGKVALDRAAWAAITGSVPLESFPYGISVQQVKARFTFTYNGGSAPPAPVDNSKKRRN
jgi:TonB family protein